MGWNPGETSSGGSPRVCGESRVTETPTRLSTSPRRRARRGGKGPGRAPGLRFGPRVGGQGMRGPGWKAPIGVGVVKPVPAPSVSPVAPGGSRPLEPQRVTE